METFANSENNNVVYYDYNYYKKTNLNGSLVDLENSDALSQAVKMWLASKKNERIRSLGGGIMYRHLGKMMDEERASQIKFDIMQGLQKDFNPPMTPVMVDVQGDYENQKWIISIVAYNSDLQVGVNTKVSFTNIIT